MRGRRAAWTGRQTGAGPKSAAAADQDARPAATDCPAHTSCNHITKARHTDGQSDSPPCHPRHWAQYGINSPVGRGLITNASDSEIHASSIIRCLILSASHSGIYASSIYVSVWLSPFDAGEEVVLEGPGRGLDGEGHGRRRQDEGEDHTLLHLQPHRQYGVSKGPSVECEISGILLALWLM